MWELGFLGPHLILSSNTVTLKIKASAYEGWDVIQSITRTIVSHLSFVGLLIPVLNF